MEQHKANESRLGSSIGYYILLVCSFIAGMPLQKVSSQVWTVSSIILVSVSLISLISYKTNHNQFSLKGLLSGEFDKAFTTALCFFLGCTLSTCYEKGMDWYQYKKELPQKLAQNEQVISDSENCILINKYLRNHNIEPSSRSLDSLKIPARLHNLVLGYFHLNDGDYHTARKFFFVEDSDNPVLDYYRGLFTYFGFDSVPRTEEGLRLIHSAADHQVLDAKIFLFYYYIMKDDVSMAKQMAKNILELHGLNTSVGVYFDESLYEKESYFARALIMEIEVLEVMLPYFMEKKQYSEGLDMIDQYSHGKDEFIGMKLAFLKASGNIPQAKKLLRRGVRRNDPYCTYMAARELVCDSNGALKSNKDISDRDFKRAERLLRKAVSMHSSGAEELLPRLYRERGLESQALLTEHFVSAQIIRQNAE